MNEKIKQLGKKAGLYMENQHPGGFPNEDLMIAENFAELIVRECISLFDGSREMKTVGLLSHTQVIEQITAHFGVEEQTVSQKMADAGYTRRPKGWTKEDEE
jgi:hypothetical protein